MSDNSDYFMYSIVGAKIVPLSVYGRHLKALKHVNFTTYPAAGQVELLDR